jgi:hypothetical protein
MRLGKAAAANTVFEPGSGITSTLATHTVGYDTIDPKLVRSLVIKRGDDGFGAF